MIDTELVKKSVALMGGFEKDELEKYDSFILAAALSISELLYEDADETDARVIRLAAAKAYHSICCTAEFAESATSFTAGEITVKQDLSAKDFAVEALRSAIRDCRTLLKSASELDETNGFAFLGV
ncbi:MAG: hypothetical protein K2K01_06185 [Eubacterium sp.]|nr:hypothetical protein [Eubacterium sp.]